MSENVTTLPVQNPCERITLPVEELSRLLADAEAKGARSMILALSPPEVIAADLKLTLETMHPINARLYAASLRARMLAKP